MSKFTDRLWGDLVREHGPTLAQADRVGLDRARRPRPRVLAAGSTLALAGVAVAVALTMSVMGSQPAFAVTRHHDGSVSVEIRNRSGIAGANRALAAMGIRERVMAVGDDQPIPLNCVAPGPGSDGRSLVIKGYPKVSTGPATIAALASPSVPATAGATTAPTYPAVGSMWHVIACPSLDTSAAS